MEIVWEILFELYLGLAEILVPEHRFKKWQETLLKVVGILVALSIVACVVAGVVLLMETEWWVAGVVTLTVGCVLLLGQVVLGIVVVAHQVKKEKAAKSQASLASDQNPDATGQNNNA